MGRRIEEKEGKRANKTIKSPLPMKRREK